MNAPTGKRREPLPELFVFDLDGTLAETHYDIAATTDHVLAHFGLPPIGPEAIPEYLGMGIEFLLAKALGPDRTSLIEEGVRIYAAHHSEHCTDRVRLYDGVEMLLRRLGTAGSRLALLSNKREIFCRRILDHTGVLSLFKAVCGSDSFPYMKPDGRALLAAIAAAGGGEAIFVGDSWTDIATARAAGVRVGFVDGGYGHVKDQEPDYHWSRVTTMSESFEGLSAGRV